MREQFSGTQQVFSFTLRQFVRNRANLISFAFTLLVVLLSMPVMAWMRGGEVEEETVERTALAWVAVDNQTDLPLTAAMLQESPFWAEVRLTDGPSAEADAVATVTGDVNGYTVTVTGTGDEYDLSCLEWDVVACVDRARVAAAGLTQQQMDALWSDYDVVLPGAGETGVPEEDFFTGDEPDMDAFWVQYGYAMAVMILCMMSASYIIRAVIEEKASKLVELLLLSVKPMALLTGKILAAMLYVFGTLLVMAGGWMVSLLAASAIFGSDSVSHITDAVSGVLPAVEEGGLELLGLAMAVVVSLLLGYLTMSVIGGLSGACCTGTDDMSSALSTVILITMTGYVASYVVAALPGQGVAVFSALCPVLSAFCAPVLYACGDISLWLLLLSWLTQILVIAALLWLTGRVYADLIINRGTRVKMKELFRMARTGKEAA